MNKIDLIYIISHGHSGSTILDLILGQQYSIESVGELIRFNKELAWDGNCSCGKKLFECDYWGSVRSTYKNKLNKNNSKGTTHIYDFISHLQSKQVNRFFKNIFLGIHNKEVPLSSFNQYSKRYHYLCQSILETTNKQLIVDSSKNHKSLYILCNSKLFNIKVIYLYRNGKELINSYRIRSKTLYNKIIKNKNIDDFDLSYIENIKNKFDRNVNIFDVIKYVYSFIVSNKNKQTIIKNLINNNMLSNKDIILVNYKDLASNPNYILSSISNQFNNEFNPETINYESSEYFLKQETHNMGGNILRTQNPKPISYMDTWEENIKFTDKLIFKFLGGERIDKKFQKLKFGKQIKIR